MAILMARRRELSRASTITRRYLAVAVSVPAILAVFVPSESVVLTFSPVAMTIAEVIPVAEPLKSILADAWPAVMVSIWLSLRATFAAKDGLAKQNDRASPPQREIILWAMLVSSFAVNELSGSLTQTGHNYLYYAPREMVKSGRCWINGLGLR
jgi:hypothetical protein